MLTQRAVALPESQRVGSSVCFSAFTLRLKPKCFTKDPSGSPTEYSFKQVTSIYFVPFSPGLLIPGASLSLIPYFLEDGGARG